MGFSWWLKPEKKPSGFNWAGLFLSTLHFKLKSKLTLMIFHFFAKIIYNIHDISIKSILVSTM